ncbi:MAG: hypothetical protein ACI4T2_02400 [Christensenellales bacterium]
MSFFLNNTSNCRPCPLKNSGVGSICEKVLIETTKVFDECLSQTQEIGLPLVITSYSPANPTFPLTFISAQATGSGVVVSDVVIDRIADRPNFANVTATVTVPTTVTYRDANGVVGTGTSSVTVTKSAILFVPQPSITPIEVTAMAALVSTSGVFSEDNTFTINACLYIVLKIVGVVDILVPSYGYPQIPECQEISTPCPGLNNISFFPVAQP